MNADQRGASSLGDSCPVRGSFRDPSGFLFERDGVLYRQIDESYGPDFTALMESGLHQSLVAAGMLVPHLEVSSSLAPEGSAWKVIQPERVSFISYPYEWCFGQLKDAALLTLDVLDRALERGLWLKDASAYNVQFVRGRPMLIDTLSFERYPEGSPWVAYRQFCQHFLAPLALMALRDVRFGQLSRLHLDGVPLDLASKLLPLTSHLRFSLAVHLHAHARMQRKHAGGGKSVSVARGMSRGSLTNFVESLRGAVRGLSWDPSGTTWSEYYEGDSYEREGLEHKKELVQRYLQACRPRTLWDLGANTGLHSRIASGEGIETVAWDLDPGAVELCYRRVVADQETHLLPLQLDLDNPSGAIGWANEERLSLAERGPVDAIMALALVHHLAIGNNVPLARIGSYFATLGRHLIMEFVPKEDPKVRHLLASRVDIFGEYTREGFEAAFSRSFVIHEVEQIRHSSRCLYRMEARG